MDDLLIRLEVSLEIKGLANAAVGGLSETSSTSYDDVRSSPSMSPVAPTGGRTQTPFTRDTQHPFHDKSRPFPQSIPTGRSFRNPPADSVVDTAFCDRLVREVPHGNDMTSPGTAQVGTMCRNHESSSPRPSVGNMRGPAIQVWPVNSLNRASGSGGPRSGALEHERLKKASSSIGEGPKVERRELNGPASPYRGAGIHIQKPDRLRPLTRPNVKTGGPAVPRAAPAFGANQEPFQKSRSPDPEDSIRKPLRPGATASQSGEPKSAVDEESDEDMSHYSGSWYERTR
ncbi:hypothetical protein VUR80DRAFT_5819 [Thermomyces stellatus]